MRKGGFLLAAAARQWGGRGASRVKRIARGWRDRFEESVGRKTSITWINGRSPGGGGTKDAFRAHELGRQRLVDAYLLTHMSESLAGISKIADTPYMALSEYAPHLPHPPVWFPSVWPSCECNESWDATSRRGLPWCG